jgi:protein-tyrosine-phosphatase
VLARLRDRVDSLLHSRRRRAAERLLENAQPHSILFICQGNICRSPFAAAAFRRLVPVTFSNSTSVSSAGFIGPGRPSPEHALTTARARGIDMSAHRSRIITSENLRAADLVVVMSRAQRRGISSRVNRRVPIIVLGDLDPQPITQRTIVDPWEGPPEMFEDSYDRINRCVIELARIIFGVNAGSPAVARAETE